MMQQTKTIAGNVENQRLNLSIGMILAQQKDKFDYHRAYTKNGTELCCHKG
jgi:hypothetical protein